MATVLLLGSTMTCGQAFRIFAINEMTRVFEDGFNIMQKADTLSVFGIRGETVSGQIVVNSLKNLENLSIGTGALANIRDGSVFPPEAVKWNFVGSVFVSQNASNQPENSVLRKAPARFPDYLMAEKELGLAAGKFQAAWLTIEIPVTVPYGTYFGNIMVKCRQGEQKIPLKLKVYPLILPEERHLKVTEWYTTAHFEKFHGIAERYSPEWFEMLRR